MSNILPENKYTDKEIVWVKLGRGIWWPGEVCGEERLPDGLLSSLKTKPISFVRFFNEDQFEFVKNLANICKYNNPKKHDFIKKGLDAYRANHKYAKEFPGDIELAERLTNGDPNIISREEFQPHCKKSVWADIFNDKKHYKSHTYIKKVKPTNLPTKMNSQEFRKSFNHKVRFLPQPSTSQPNSNSSSNIPKSTEQIYRCHLCDFNSKRVNVVMLHSKLHSSAGNSNIRQNIVSQTNINAISSLNAIICTRNTNETLIKKMSSDSSDNDDAVCITRKDIILPKKRGRPFIKEPVKVQKPNKSRIRGKRKYKEIQPELKKDAIKEDISNQKDDISTKLRDDIIKNDMEIISSSKKFKTEIKVELKTKLLADWVEDDSDCDNKSPNKSLSGDIIQPDNSMNSTCEDLSNVNYTKENKINHSDISNSNTITKYRNIPKKDRKREFIFDEITSPTPSTELYTSQLSKISNIYNENDSADHINEDFKTRESESGNINLTTLQTRIPTEHFKIIYQDELNLKVAECVDDMEIKSKDNILSNITPIIDKDNQELDDSTDTVKSLILKPSEITCFDFQDDDDIEFAKSPPRRHRNLKSVSMTIDMHPKLDRIIERVDDIQKETEKILDITDPPQLPDFQKLLEITTAECLSTSFENIVSGKKEHSLPPKERGKRIFKSRNRNKIPTGNLTQLTKKHILEYGIEKIDDDKPLSKPTESDLQIAETLINIPTRTSQTVDSSLDKNNYETSVISDNNDNTMIDNLPVHVSRKKHLQATFKAEEEKHKGSLSNLDTTSSLSNKQSMQLFSVAENSPKQKMVLKLKEEVIASNLNKFEPRTPKKRKTATDDCVKTTIRNSSIDENIFDINNMEIVISDDVIQNEPIEHIQPSIEPIVIQTISDNTELDTRDGVKENNEKTILTNIKPNTIGHLISPHLESKKKLAIVSDTILTKRPKLNINRHDINSQVSTNTSTYKKSQIIQATAGGQIVITSKGQLLTTNSQAQLTSTSQTCETTSSCVKSISSTKSKESASKIQVQSQRIIYPCNKIKSSKTKLIDKHNTESPNKVKMSLQSVTEMTKLGYIKEKGTERIITATGLKRIKQHLLTGSKDRIPPLTQNNNSSSDTNLTITSNSISQLTLPLQLPTAPKLSDISLPGDTIESPPQIISTSPLNSTTSTEITENYYACAAESFGGPPNSFYLCRAGENNTFIPIDNRALYLDANNRLVEDMPDIINSFDTISNQNTAPSTILNCEHVNSLELNSTNSDNIQIQDVPQSFIINTLDGQQIILDQQSFLSLAAGEMPHLITADGQQIILQGSPQDIITAIAVNQQDIGLITEDQHIILPHCESQSTLSTHDIISVALEGSEVYQRPESIIGNVIIQNLPTSDMVNVQNSLPTATATVLSNPIMSTLEVPTKATSESNNLTLESGLNIDDSLAVIGVNTTNSNVPSSLELPITVTNPAIASKTSPLSLNTIYTPTISSIETIGQISQISPSLGYDLFDTSSSSSSSKGIAACSENNGNMVRTNIAISQLNSHTEHLNLNNSNCNDNNIDEEMENGNIIPQSPEIEINVSSVNDANQTSIAGEIYDDNSDNSDEIPIQPNLIIYNNENNNIDNCHEIINLDNNRKSHIDEAKQSSQNSNINNTNDDRS